MPWTMASYSIVYDCGVWPCSWSTSLKISQLCVEVQAHDVHIHQWSKGWAAHDDRYLLKLNDGHGDVEKQVGWVIRPGLVSESAFGVVTQKASVVFWPSITITKTKTTITTMICWIRWTVNKLILFIAYLQVPLSHLFDLLAPRRPVTHGTPRNTQFEYQYTGHRSSVTILVH